MKAVIGRGYQEYRRKDKVGTLWEGVRIENKASRKGSTFSQQEKEVTENIKVQYLQETSQIMAHFQAENNRFQRLYIKQKNWVICEGRWK